MRLVYWETKTDCGYVTTLKDVRAAIGLAKHERIKDDVFTDIVTIDFNQKSLAKALNEAIRKGANSVKLS